MANGKGSSRRQFDKKREQAFKEHHTDVYGEREKVDGRKTRIVVVGGRLVEKNLNRDIFAIDPATFPPTTYFEHRDWLLDHVNG